MSKKYEVVYESDVKVINEQRSIVVQVQEGKLPVLVISQMYPVDDGNEWGFCSPRVSGAVSFRLAMSSRQIGWLIKELEKSQVVVEKAEKAATKTTKPTPKSTKPATTKKAVVDDDLELEVNSSRTRRIRR